MQYTTLGSTGLVVSRFSFGAMTFGEGRLVGNLHNDIDHDIEHEVVPFCQDAGVGVLVWSPLSSGFLTGKYTRDNPAPEDARRNKFNFPPADVEKGYEVVAALSRVGQRVGASPAQAALARLLARPFVSSVIVGATSTRQLEENLKAASVTLPPEGTAELDELTRPQPLYPGWMQPMGVDAKVKEALAPTR